jgi:putative transposase
MQWINVSYATYYNKRWQMVGHLFQGRFQAILVDADAYLIEVSRYVHLNPVRAKLVSAPGDYPWSSYRGFIGQEKAAEWVETGVVLGSFGASKRQAYKRYKSFVEAGDATSVDNPAQGIVGGFILGSEQFVDWVKEKFLSAREDNKEIPQLRELKPRVGLKTMVEAVCKEFSCSEEQIRKKGRKGNKARQVAVYLARDLSGLRCTDLGMYFGGVSGALITMMHNRVATEISENKSMRGRIAKIKSRFLNI